MSSPLGGNQHDREAETTDRGASSASPHLLDRDVVILQQVRSVMKNDFEIYGVDGEVIGRILTQGGVLGRLMFGSRELQVVDVEGRAVLTITDPANWLRDTYEVYRTDSRTRLALISRKFSFFRSRLDIALAGHPSVEFRGDFFDYNAEIISGDQQIAVIQRQWAGVSHLFMGRQRYCLRFMSGLSYELRAAILGTAIAADLIRAKAARHSY